MLLHIPPTDVDTCTRPTLMLTAANTNASKTIANMCYSKQRLRDQQVNNVVASKTEIEKTTSNIASSDTSTTPSNGHAPDIMTTEVFPRKNRIKQVHLHMHDSDELGMAILGTVYTLIFSFFREFRTGTVLK